MSQLQAIFKYQEVDAKLYKIERELAGCEERKEYVKYKKFLEGAPEKLDALDVRANALKTEASELMKKFAQVEEVLKDFQNVDDLVSSGADVTFYKKKAQSIVEQLKKIKADLTTLTANIKATETEYQKLKKQVISAQKQYAEVAEKYKTVKTSREAERKEIDDQLTALAGELPVELFEKYKTKRKERIFPVVGELTGNRCPYCSMEPPLAAINKLSGGNYSECDNCHRLIFNK